MGRLCMELVTLGTLVGQPPAPAVRTDLQPGAETEQAPAEGSGGGADTEPKEPALGVRAEEPGIQIPEERG